jgi:methionyl-tRNA formyltransferase
LAAQARLSGVVPDVLVVAAYGLILPQQVLDIPRGLRKGWMPKLSALNIHASLLPRWRGAAPIARAIEAGDDETGITIMQMDAGLDTGPMLAAERVSIAPDDTADTLTSKLAYVGARLIVDALRNVDRLVATPQPSGATYAAKLNKSEAWLDWSQTADQLERKVRAFNPFPIASSLLNGSTVRIWRAQASGDRLTDPADVGSVKSADASGVRVACGVGELLITELQRANGKRVMAREFVSGFPVHVGDRFVGPQTVATE